MTLYFTKESDSLAKLTKDILILPLEPQATIVWFPEDTCTTFQVAKIHARMIKFHQKYAVESISSENVNPRKSRIAVINFETFTKKKTN